MRSKVLALALLAGCSSSGVQQVDLAEAGGAAAAGKGGVASSAGAPGAASGASTTGGAAGVPGVAVGGTSGAAGLAGAAGASGAAGAPSGEFGYSKKLHLDTTAAGANVSGDVTDYPLAVTLSAESFDFTLAREKGEDVRFFDAAGQPLAHAIEHWDRAASQAAIWVKLPLVKGNDASQLIVMRWGNALAADASDSVRVFARESGFLAVFHLDQDGNSSDGGYKDSSWNQVHGTGQKLTAGSLVPGRIGKATKLSNEGGGSANAQWIRVGGGKVADDFNATEEHAITASAWAWADTFNGYYETVFSKGDRSWTLQRDYQGRMESCTRVDGYHSCAIAGPPATKAWVHYVITQRPGNLTLYINGESKASAGGTSVLGAHDFGIGNQSQYPAEKRGWDGILDEARVLSVEKNAAWVKLEYESQREGQKLIVFGPTE